MRESLTKTTSQWFFLSAWGIYMCMNIEEQKKTLLENKASLEEELSSLGRELSEGGDWVVVPNKQQDNYADPLDEAEVTEELEEDLAVLQVLEAQYQQVQKALKAIEEGTYGICEVTGKNISEERLRANPSATTSLEVDK